MLSGPPLRIAMLVPPWYELPPPGYGGLELVVAGLIDALVDRGHRVTLFGAGTRSGTGAEFVSTVPDTQHARLGQSLPELAHVGRADQLIDEGGFDVKCSRRSGPTLHSCHPSVVFDERLPAVVDSGQCETVQSPPLVMSYSLLPRTIHAYSAAPASASSA